MNAHWRPDPDAEHAAREGQRRIAAQHTPDIHWGHTMRPRTARRVNGFLLLMAAGAVLAAGAMATARADDIATLSGVRTVGPHLFIQERCYAPWSLSGAMGGRLA